MKIRQAFVSNSSSMSFVVSKDDYATIKDLAKAMINFMAVDDPEWYGGERQKKFLKQLEKAPDFDGLTFYSCNYDTNIYDDGSRYFVDTCNNHDGWSFLEDKDLEYPEFVIKNDFYDIHKEKSEDKTIYGSN